MNKMYQSPAVKVVSFKVEDAFGSIQQNGEVTNNVINFGGSEETGLMSHDSYDHSGLGQYGYNSDLFGGN